MIKVKQGLGPNIGANLLLNHAEPTENVVIKGKRCWVRISIKEVKTPMSKVWQDFVKAGILLGVEN